MSRLLGWLGGPGCPPQGALIDPFTGVNFEDEGEPLSPALTIISVGPNAW
jgi:hypothetical protein